tara:strand:+ start:997 stop:1104 length:108 start_codon:yes stop_codon:yes gene_type:complete
MNKGVLIRKEDVAMLNPPKSNKILGMDNIKSINEG